MKEPGQFCPLGLAYITTVNIRIQPPPGYAELLAEFSEYEKEVLLRIISSVKAILVQGRGML